MDVPHPQPCQLPQPVLPYNRIVSWETGKTAPKMEKAQELSDLYGIPLAYMDFSKVGNSTPLRERESEPQIPAF